MIAPDFDTAFAEFVTARQSQAMAAQTAQSAAERQAPGPGPALGPITAREYVNELMTAALAEPEPEPEPEIG
jgi:hypothetical protein